MNGHFISEDIDGLDSDDEEVTIQVSNPMNTVVKWQIKT